MKKPQQTLSSHPSEGSPCDTNSIVNEFGDIELPNLNSIANLSTGFSNLPTQSYENNVNMNMLNMNLNMNNWAAAAREAAAAATIPSLAWPSSLLTSNLSMNSLLLKALQLKNNYQAREATSHENSNSFLQQQAAGISRFESDLSSNFQASSSSKVLESVPVAVPQPQQEQPFNLDSIW